MIFCVYPDPEKTTPPLHATFTVLITGSVADRDPSPDPSDPYVFGPPGSGSGSSSQMYGSGSFYHQAKIVIPTVL
jgi:hypothetical protein